MSFTLGFKQERLTVKLPKFGVFTAALVSSSEDGWPLGTEIELRFYVDVDADDDPVATWPATIVGRRADWHVPQSDIREVRDAGLGVSRLFYSDPGTEIDWAVGVIQDVG